MTAMPNFPGHANPRRVHGRQERAKKQIAVAAIIAAGTMTPLAASADEGMGTLLSPDRSGSRLEMAVPSGGATGAGLGEAATGFAVEFGAFTARGRAKEAWLETMAAAGDLLSGLSEEISAADVGGETGVIYRLRAGPVTDRTTAQSLCTAMEARSISCSVVSRPSLAAEDPDADDRPLQIASTDPVSLAEPEADAPVSKAEPETDEVVPDRQVAYSAYTVTGKRENFLPNAIAANRAYYASSSFLYEMRGPRDLRLRAHRQRAKDDPLFQVVDKEGAVEDESRISDEVKPFLTEGDIPDRAPLLLEIGDPFLDTGELQQGWELPTGAVWQPRLWVFGTLRSAVQTIDTGDPDRISEWVNRFDLFANLQLTGTEKGVLGIRPFDLNRPDKFSGYQFEPDRNEGFQNDLNGNIRTLFFEGDLGSLFPVLDPTGTSLLDFGFTVGRQPIIFQDGILLSDTQDILGLTRNNIRLPGVSNLRIAAVYGSDLFDEVTRTAGGIGAIDDEDLQLIGLFTEWDTRKSTINADIGYVWDDTQDDGDAIAGGVSAAQRIGHLNTTFRVNASLAKDDESALVRDGVLLSTELSWTPYGTNDTAYFNPFVAFGEFIQLARERIDGGGPLAALGILFASPNIGNFGSEINNRANDLAGVALGYQAFWDDNRRNLAVEFAFRKDLGLDDPSLSPDGFDQYALGFQLQQAVGQRMLLQLEGFGALQEDRDTAYGGRFEVLYQF